jgi:hypothetical protein
VVKVTVPPPPPRPPVIPPTPPPRSPPRDPVKEFKRKLYVIYHAVEEYDWKRLREPDFMKILDEIEPKAKELESRGILRTRYLSASEIANTLKDAIKDEDAERALWAIAEFLFGLPP